MEHVDHEPSDTEDAPILTRDELVREHLSLVKRVATRIAMRLPPNVELDDLIGSGMIGLIDAVDKFDQAKSSNFRKYAEIRIKGAILDELRALDHASRTVRRQTTQLLTSLRALQDELGRTPTHDEAAAHLGLDLGRYHALLDKLKPVLVLGFGDISDDRGRDALQFLPNPAAADPGEALLDKDLRTIVQDQIDTLKERHKLVIRFYYFDGMTLKEIGRVFDVSESRISQILTEATKVLRRRVKRRFEDRAGS